MRCLLMMVVGVAGQVASQQPIQDQIDVLLRADQHLMQQVKDIRTLLNVKLPNDLQALAKRTEWNREAIVRIATLSQGELMALLAKVNSQSQELAEVKSVAERILPEVDRKLQTELAQENQKLDAVAGASQQADSAARRAEQETQATAMQETEKLKEVAKWLQNEFSREDVQLKRLMQATKDDADGAAQAMQTLLKEEDAQLEQQIAESRHKIANVTQMVEKSLPQARMDFEQQLGEMGRKLEAVALEFEDARRQNQDELQFQSNQLLLLKDRLDEASGRYQSVTETLDGVVRAQRVSLFLVLPSLIVGAVGFLAFQSYGQRSHLEDARSPAHTPLREPLLAATRADSEMSFSVITPHAAFTHAQVHTSVPEPHRFLPSSTFSSTEGTVEAEALRPKALVRSAVGTSLEVQSVTFRHLSECEVVELSLGEALPTTTVVANHRVMLVGHSCAADKVVCASELRAGDRIAFAGADVEISGVCPRVLSHVTIVEVEFSPDEPVGTLLDVGEQQFTVHHGEPQFSFHVV